MASENANHDAPVPFKLVLENNSNLIHNPPQEYDNFMASLPLKFFNHLGIRHYQGFWVPEQFLLGFLAVQEHFKPRPNDIFIASYPKSGTTWLKALVFGTMTRNSYPLDQNPLLSYNPHQCVATMETEFSLGKRQILEALSSPRVLSTHMPYSILPDSITSSDCRIIYIWRDPKDVLVSLWHFLRRINEGTPRFSTFVESFDMFCEGICGYGPIWDHIIGYWQESKRKPKNVLFLKYENMLMEPIKYSRILAKFIGCPYSKDEENQDVIEKIVDLCSFEKLANLEVNKGRCEPIFRNKNLAYDLYFRKGMVGDWRNHMTHEMAQKLDKIVADKFKEHGFEMSEIKNEATLDILQV